MAVVVENTGSAQNTSDTTISCNVTVSGSSTYLLAHIGLSSAGGLPTISSVEYNSESMNLVDSQTAGTNVGGYIYELKNPTAGTNSLDVTVNTTTDELGLVGVAHSGVDQTTSLGTIVKEGLTTGNHESPQELSPASAIGDLIENMSYFVAFNSTNATLAVSQSETSLAEQENIGNYGAIGAATKTAGSPTTTTGWNNGDTATYGQVLLAFAVKPTATVTPTLTLPTGTETGPFSCSGTVTTNEDTGTLYYYISTSGTSPSIANHKDGTGSTAFGNQSVTATGVQNITSSGLAAETLYYIHYLHTVTGDSNQVVSLSFTTDASGGGGAAPIVSHLTKLMNQ